MMRFALTALATTVCTAALATPTTMHHQGRILDTSGDALNGSPTIHFNLWDQETGGTSKWNESLAVALEEGYYSVILGTSSALDSSVFTGEDRWLGLRIEPSATELQSRTLIRSVAYATAAATAEVAPVHGDGVQGSADVNQSGTGTTAISQMTATITPASTSNKIWFLFTGNLRVYGDTGDRCVLRVKANGGGFSDTTVAIGELYHGTGTGHEGHTQGALSGLISPTQAGQPIVLTMEMEAVDAGGATVNCYVGHRADNTFVAMELAP